MFPLRAGRVVFICIMFRTQRKEQNWLPNRLVMSEILVLVVNMTDCVNISEVKQIIKGSLVGYYGPAYALTQFEKIMTGIPWYLVVLCVILAGRLR